jgi:CubicO group peptidase (beta-lactamase class C family)
LRARDLLRIGEMVLACGVWDGKHVVSREWLEASFVPVMDVDEGRKYGRLWYIGEGTTPALTVGAHKWVGGFGNGGQRLFVMPDAKLAAAMFFGAYNQPDQWIAPLRIWREIVLANLNPG